MSAVDGVLWKHEAVGSIPTTLTKFYARVMELVVLSALEADAVRRVGSSPTLRTKF